MIDVDKTLIIYSFRYAINVRKQTNSFRHTSN